MGGRHGEFQIGGQQEPKAGGVDDAHHAVHEDAGVVFEAVHLRLFCFVVGRRERGGVHISGMVAVVFRPGGDYVLHTKDHARLQRDNVRCYPVEVRPPQVDGGGGGAVLYITSTPT